MFKPQAAPIAGFQNIIERSPYEDYFTEGFSPDVADTIISLSFKDAAPRENPAILHMLGVPGAGKSTYVHSLPLAGKVLVSFDKITEMIPGYQSDRKKLGAALAFENWELPARMLGYHILHLAAAQKNDIVFDHGGSRADHVAFLRSIKDELGYTIDIVHIAVDKDIAGSRVEKRERDGGRHVPSSYIPEREILIGQLIPQYKQIADSFKTIEI